MRYHFRNAFALLALVTLAAAGCGDPSGPSNDEDVNPALLDTSGGVGGAMGGSDGIPQGDARMTGPGGLLLDATAEEFVQQFATTDGVVLKTSGVSVRAVPDESVEDAPIDRMTFFAAYPGSLESVDIGSHEIMPDTAWPVIDFVTPAHVNGAGVRVDAETGYSYAAEGEFRITSIVYDDEVHTCDLDDSVARIDLCEYVLGTLRGTIRFEVDTEVGTVVQSETDFEVPIRRRVIMGEFTN